MRRPPWSVCAWNQRFKSIPYNSMRAEDWDWVKRAIEEAKTEVFLDVIVCKYCFDPYNTSDANTRIERPSERPELQKPFQFIRRM
jgi:hypothetical protein